MAPPDEVKLRIRDFITARSGLYFKDHDLKDLHKVIEKRRHALRLDSESAYYNYLHNPGNREDELRELLNLLTINHTYFFRNEAQFKALKERVLPEIMARKLRETHETAGTAKPTLRIWSAGCSTGEEPYSIAITLRELIPDIDGWDILILATDASSEALKKAKEGVYSAHSVKFVGRSVLSKYFSLSGGSPENPRYKIDDSLRAMVQFGYFNLMEGEYPRNFDVIFCRNVVIYFEFGTTVKVMNMFHDSLDDLGYIFIGYSETLQYLHDKFRMVAWEDSIYYRKAHEKPLPEKAKPAAGPPEKEVDIGKALENIAKAEVLAVAAEAKTPPPHKMEELSVEIVKAIHLQEYAKALDLIGKATTLDRNAVAPHYMAAEIYMNQGRNDEARSRLSKALAIDPLFAPAYYLSGCIYMVENAFEKAKESLRKAIYLDGSFLIAHFYIAQVFKSEGNAAKAIREYRNTLNLLSRAGSEDIIAYSGGYNAATLMSVVRDNLERLKFEQ